MQTARLKPADGLTVRLEDGSGYLASEGQTLPLTGYWHRRIADGDVTRLPDTEQPDETAEKPATTTRKTKEA